MLAGQQWHEQCEGRASGSHKGYVPVNQNRMTQRVGMRVGIRVGVFVADYWMATRPKQWLARRFVLCGATGMGAQRRAP